MLFFSRTNPMPRRQYRKIKNRQQIQRDNEPNAFSSGVQNGQYAHYRRDGRQKANQGRNRRIADEKGRAKEVQFSPGPFGRDSNND
jgi:hypothetical protein